MATDFLYSMGHKMEEGNRYTISLSAQSRAEAERLYNGLSEDGQIETQLSNSSRGSYFGMFKDKFSIKWMVDFDPKYSG